ncbi:hypothetical protein [Streptomyces sp. JHA26]|uniref:hypothetical protein n=1 Tax=Streptomyces sp. JHA26 TaxID=1917143 RepID=UPI0015C52C55|nr:hypothetical protein [Streptomyces sp. JHA26]
MSASVPLPPAGPAATPKNVRRVLLGVEVPLQKAGPPPAPASTLTSATTAG